MTTAFERALLPAFARWFVERVETVRPDYLVPAETKGARLLDVVLDYARRELGISIQVPILYRPALPYVGRETLSQSRVLVLDDAKRTGNSFDRHCQRLEEFGVADIHAAFCVCFCPEGQSEEDAFLAVTDEEEYSEYICLMTELVTVGGLPPEIDHHVFELRLPGSLRFAWGRLEAVLGRYGELSVDVAKEEWGVSSALTLHFPKLPGTHVFPVEGEVRDDGPRKVRLFPDEIRNRVYVVPVSFPTLDLPGDATQDLSPEDARGRIREWTGSESSLAELLTDGAERRDPETMYRALSAFAEVDLVRGLARALATAFGTEGLAIELQEPLADRLYGDCVGGEIIARIRSEIAAALNAPAAVAAAGEDSAAVPLFVDRGVVETTESIADDLRVKYRERREKLNREPKERVGRSLAEISGEFPIKRLLASRCIDFGLALTTLVPYVDVDCRQGEICRVSRKYRVSEQGDIPSDRLVDNQRVAEEIVAYISLYFGKRSTRFKEAHLPVDVVTRILAMLNPQLRERNVAIEIRVRQGELRAEVSRGEPAPLIDDASPSFAIADGAIVPTDEFLEANANRELRIDVRKLIMPLEGFFEPLVRLVDLENLGEADFATLLTGAAMSADEGLGLTYFREPFESALDGLERQLLLAARRHSHSRDEGLALEVGGKLDFAREVLEVLDSDWAAPIRGLWGDFGATETSLLQTTGVPKERLHRVFLLPHALSTALECLAEVVFCVEACSVRLWEEDKLEGEMTAKALSASATLAAALGSLRAEGPAPRQLPDEPRDQVIAAATAALEVLGVLRAFAAACSRDNRGPRRGEPLPEVAENDRHSTVLFPDLDGSREHGRNHDFDDSFNWKEQGLGLFAQWARAFGGLETQNRKGDCSWLEFDKAGDPAVVCAAAARVHTAALRATYLVRPRWRAHIAVNFGRIKEGDINNSISRVLDEMNEMCRVGDDGTAESINVTRAVRDACSPELRETASVTRLDTSGCDGKLPRGCELWAIATPSLVEALAARLQEVSAKVLADLRTLGVDDEYIERATLDAGVEAGTGTAG